MFSRRWRKLHGVVPTSWICKGNRWCQLLVYSGLNRPLLGLQARIQYLCSIIWLALSSRDRAARWNILTPLVGMHRFVPQRNIRLINCNVVRNDGITRNYMVVRKMLSGDKKVLPD